MVLALIHPNLPTKGPSRIGIIHESYPGIADADWFDTAQLAVQVGATLRINETNARLPTPIGTSPGTQFYFIPAVGSQLMLKVIRVLLSP